MTSNSSRLVDWDSDFPELYSSLTEVDYPLGSRLLRLYRLSARFPLDQDLYRLAADCFLVTPAELAAYLAIRRGHRQALDFHWQVQEIASEGHRPVRHGCLALSKSHGHRTTNHRRHCRRSFAWSASGHHCFQIRPASYFAAGFDSSRDNVSRINLVNFDCLNCRRLVQAWTG